jgi:hypothetical protein
MLDVDFRGLGFTQPKFEADVEAIQAGKRKPVTSVGVCDEHPSLTSYLLHPHQRQHGTRLSSIAAIDYASSIRPPVSRPTTALTCSPRDRREGRPDRQRRRGVRARRCLHQLLGLNVVEFCEYKALYHTKLFVDANPVNFDRRLEENNCLLEIAEDDVSVSNVNCANRLAITTDAVN